MNIDSNYIYQFCMFTKCSIFHLKKHTFSLGCIMIDVPKKAKKFVLKKQFDGLPKLEDFELVEEDIPELQVGGTVYRCTRIASLINYSNRHSPESN